MAPFVKNILFFQEMTNFRTGGMEMTLFWLTYKKNAPVFQ